LPRSSGDSINFTRYSTLTRQTTPLSQGVNPSAGQTLTASIISATAREWGDYVTISSFLDLTSIDPKVSETSALLGIQAGETIDYVLQADVLTASDVTGQRIFPTGQHFSAGDVTSVLDTTLMRRASYQLRQAKAIRFEGNYWVAIISPASEFDLTGDDSTGAVSNRVGWHATQEYAGSERIFQGEIGKWFGIRFVEDTQPITFDVSGTVSADGDGAVHPTAVFGQEAYGATELDGRKIIIKESGPQDTGNPLNMYKTVGWKQVFANLPLNGNWIYTIMTGATLSG
jgi:N4-gp56 family major capsid protein